MFVRPAGETQAEEPAGGTISGIHISEGREKAVEGVPHSQESNEAESTRFQVNVGIRAIKVAAADDGLRVSQVVAKALRAYLNQRSKS